MAQLLARYGLAAVFVGTAVEGDASMLFAGVLAHVGVVRLALALAAGALGAFAGDCVLFALGRRGGPWLRGNRAWATVGPVVERLAGRVGVWQVVTARFVYGTRIVSMLFWGLRGTPFAHFALADLAGCVTWALLLGLAGFALSGTAEALLGEVERVEIWLAAALAAVAVLALGLRVASRRLRRA